MGMYTYKHTCTHTYTHASILKADEFTIDNTVTVYCINKFDGVLCSSQFSQVCILDSGDDAGRVACGCNAQTPWIDPRQQNRLANADPLQSLNPLNLFPASAKEVVRLSMSGIWLHEKYQETTCSKFRK